MNSEKDDLTLLRLNRLSEVFADRINIGQWRNELNNQCNLSPSIIKNLRPSLN